MPVLANIDAAQKQLSSLQSNIGGVQKQLSSLLCNVEGVNKELMVQNADYWAFPYVGTATISTSSYSRMVADSATVSSSGTFTLVNPVAVTGRPASGKFMVAVSNAASTATTGTTLYYTRNTSGSCYSFNISSTGVFSTATTLKETKPDQGDVFYSSNKLYVKKSKVPTVYRWTQYNINSNYSDVWASGTYSLYAYGQSAGEIKYWALNETLQVSTGSDTYTFSEQWYFGSGPSGYDPETEWGYYMPLNGTDTTSSKAYRISSAVRDGSGDCNISFDGYYTRTSTQTQGAATGKYAYSITSSAYPTNGAQSGYWYANRTTAS